MLYKTKPKINVKNCANTESYALINLTFVKYISVQCLPAILSARLNPIVAVNS